jgi:hypothetical protein
MSRQALVIVVMRIGSVRKPRNARPVNRNSARRQSTPLPRPAPIVSLLTAAKLGPAGKPLLKSGPAKMRIL